MSTTQVDLSREIDAPSEKRPTSFAHRLYTSDFHFQFIKHRKVYYLFSATLLLISFLALGIRHLNLGIEFKGGSVFTVPIAVASNSVDQYRQVVSSTGLPNLTGAQVQVIGGNTIRVQTRSLNTDEVTTMRGALAAKATLAPEAVNYSLIGPSWGKQITSKAMVALVVFLVLVALLILMYFRDWRMSVSALIALVHDLIITIGIYSLVGFTFSPASLIGVLTILGYSLYDTVVVFDKVRENTRDVLHQNRTYSDGANKAVNQVLVRSINTTLIGVLPVLAILIAGVIFLGGEGPLPDLGLALFIGMVIGAYSSIFIATPLLAQLREAQPDMVAHRQALERRASRAQTKVEATIATVAGPASPASLPTSVVDASAAPASTTAQDGRSDKAIPTSDAASGRPQPVRSSRSNRKK